MTREHGVVRVAVHVRVAAIVVVVVVVVVIVEACLPPFIPALIRQEEEYGGAECRIYVRARSGFVAIAVATACANAGLRERARKGGEREGEGDVKK